MSAGAHAPGATIGELERPSQKDAHLRSGRELNCRRPRRLPCRPSAEGVGSRRLPENFRPRLLLPLHSSQTQPVSRCRPAPQKCKCRACLRADLDGALSELPRISAWRDRRVSEA